MNRFRSLTVVAATIVVLGVSGVPVRAAKECSAEVKAELARTDVRDEATVKFFRVEIDTPEDCAKVFVDLVVTERLFNGEEIKSTRRESRKVTAQASYGFEHRIARDSDLAAWEFKVAQCVVCGTE